MSVLDCKILEEMDHWSFTDRDGVQVRGGEVSRDNDTVINFLAGTAFACQIYWPYLKHLTQHNDLVWHDYKGHGDSENGDGEFDCWGVTTDRARSVLDQKYANHQGKKKLGLGHSYGGAMTLILAAQHPELFSGLVLIDPFMVPEKFEDTYRSMTDMLVSKTRERNPVWSSTAAVKEYMATKFMFQDWSDEAIDAFIAFNLDQHEDETFTLKCPPTIEAGVYDDKVTALWPSVENLKVPTFILSGDKTVPFFAEGHRIAADMNPNIELISVKGGHNFMQEHPEASVEATLTAIRKLLD